MALESLLGVQSYNSINHKAWMRQTDRCTMEKLNCAPLKAEKAHAKKPLIQADRNPLWTPLNTFPHSH